MSIFSTVLLSMYLILSDANQYRWYDVSVNDVISTKNDAISFSNTQDSNNNGFLLVSGAATTGGCAWTYKDANLITYINGNIVEQAIGIETLPWNRIRYTQQFWGGTSCWSIFGEPINIGDGNGRTFKYGLKSFNTTIDTVISNNIIAGSWIGQTYRCDNDASNHWHIYRGSGYKGSLRVELRRYENMTDVGIGTSFNCMSNPSFKYSFIQVGYDQNCEQHDSIKHINWDSLLNVNNNADQIPYSNFTMGFDMNSIQMNFDINLEYVGLSTDGNINNEYNLGTTYVIDFQSFETNGYAINKPGNCQNRLSTSFDNITDFSQIWSYSDYPYDNNLGNIYLSYPPPSQYWILSIDDFACSPINYNAIFSWNDLTQCQDYNGNDLINVFDDGTSITLSGSIYVNLVSPYSMSTIDTGIYRTFPLIQQDFSISILKQINILSSTGIELFITSIIGIYEDETDESFELSVLTQSADYILLNNPSIISTPLGAATITSVTSSCLVSSSYTCGQIYTITINQTQINCPPADFSGVYQMAFTVTCPGNEAVCNTFIDDNGGTSVALEVTSNFIDHTCQPEIYQVIFNGNMTFYHDTEFIIVHDNNNGDNNYIIGQSIIYAEIEVNFPDDGSGDNLDIFGVEIDNVFVCTADDNIDLIHDLNQQNGAGGCLSSNIDVDGPYDIILNGIVNAEYQAQIILNNIASNIVRFSFLTFDVGRTRMYVHTQLNLILKSGERRRLQAVQSGLNDHSNQIRHFIDSTAVSQQIISEKIVTTITKEHETNSASELSIWIYTVILNAFGLFLYC